MQPCAGVLLSLHSPVARAARALAGRYTDDRPNYEPRAQRYAGLATRSYRLKTVFPRSRDHECAANWCTNFNCSFGSGFGDGLGLWLSSGHLLLSGDGLGLWFWIMVLE